MIEGLKPYLKSKKSGALWLPEIPATWDMRRNGRLFVERNETNAGELPILEVSLRTGVRVRNFDAGSRKQVMEDREKYKRARKGDLAYNMMRMWQGAVGVVPTDGLVSPAYVVARPLPGVLPAYFDYLFRTDAYKRQVNDYSRGIVADRNRLYWDSFKQIPTPFPPPDEQAAIVKFLDHADRQINRYIRAKRKLIALLNEQKQAIIHRAVTRGLDPNVKLKPSGVEWLGDVPMHWEIIRFKKRVGFQEGPGIMAADFRSEGVPLLRISCLRDAIATLNGCNFLDAATVERKWAHFAVKKGDYLLSASASTGSVSLAMDEVAGAIPYTGIIRLWPLRQGVFMPFVRLYMGCEPFKGQIDAAKSGVGIEHFGPTHLKRMVMVLPPSDEQRAIVEAIEQRTSSFQGSIYATVREIDLLREYRTRLVADVVTGDCFDAANVERFDAWMTVAYPDALAEIPEHERRDFTAVCVRHRAIKEGRYRSPRAGRRLPRRQAEVHEGDEAGDGSGEA